MTDEQVSKAIDLLLIGPYAGHGGKTALAKDLGLDLRSLRRLAQGKCQGSYAVRQRLAALSRERGVG